MEIEKKFIVFDLGAENGRCVVAVIKDEKITLNEVHRFITHSTKYSSGFYWDILAIYEEIVEGLRNAQKCFGSDFDGIGIDTWGVDYVLVDAEDRIMGNPYHYRDERTDTIMDEAFKIVTKEYLYKNIGISFTQFNTLFQLLSEKKRTFNQLNYADKMLLMPDFLNFILSGIKRSEYSIASTTSLADPKTRDWHWEIIDAFGLPRHIFPLMVEPGYKLGPLLNSIAEKTGLSNNIPVFACAGHDTASAVISIPATKENWAYLSSGTWSLMGVELFNPILTPDAMKFNFTNEGGVQRTTTFHKNIIGLWAIQECRRYWLENGEDYSYIQLTGLAEEEGEANVWVDLNDQRFFQSGKMPEKIKEYLKESGQTVKSNPGFIVRVVLESLAYAYRFTIKQIEEVTGIKIDILHAVGGGIKNKLLMQFTSDAIERTVVAGPIEGSTIGNIGILAITSGAVTNLASWRNIIAQSFEVKSYKPVNTEYFNRNEAKFKEIIKKM